MSGLRHLVRRKELNAVLSTQGKMWTNSSGGDDERARAANARIEKYKV